MNDLITITNEVATCKRKEVARQIMTVCRAITPQFYRHLSKQEVQAERLSVELLTADISNEILAKMCELAVKSYPAARSADNRVYFDINYILTFYSAAERAIDFYNANRKLFEIDPDDI